MTIDDGRADVTDDVISRRNGGVRQQRQHGFEAAAGHTGEADIRLATDELIETLTSFRSPPQQLPVEIGGKPHAPSPSGGSGSRAATPTQKRRGGPRRAGKERV